METKKTYYRVDRKNISYVKFIFEACEGLAVLSTEDPRLSVLKFSIPPGCEKEFESVIGGLSQEIMIEKWVNEGEEIDIH